MIYIIFRISIWWYYWNENIIFFIKKYILGEFDSGIEFFMWGSGIIKIFIFIVVVVECV